MELKIIMIIALLGVISSEQRIELRDDLKKYYDQFGVEGSFALYDQKKDLYILCNEGQFERPFSPASTFKICNSLIGLETGVIKDEHFVIAWDSVTRQNPHWNTDHDLRSAFQNSTVWYYQELARRVGKDQMKDWLDKVNYGNADTSGGIDKFWLTGGLAIAPKEQIEFLRRLHNNELPFSQRSMDIVKEIMIETDTLDHVLRGKTGWGTDNDQDIGWYVGYIETGDNVYYFANCIQTSDPKNGNFARARVDIANLILDDLGTTK